MKKIKKTILIYKGALTQAEQGRIMSVWNSDEDCIIIGDIDIYEKDLETGRLTQIR